MGTHNEEKILKNGKKKMVRAKGHLEQKLIITFSRKMMEYQRSIRNGLVLCQDFGLIK